MEAFVVLLEGQEQRFFPGATVRDLIGRLPQGARRAIEDGRAFMGDAAGHRLGEAGALAPGARYRVIEAAQ